MSYIAKPWYAKWWVIALLIFALIAVVYGVLFLNQVYRFKKGIESGEIKADFSGSQTRLRGTPKGARPKGPGPTGLAPWAWPLLATADDPSLGPQNASIVIVEFSDFECPFCRQSFPIVREIVDTYKNKVRLIYRDFPIQDAHPHAQKAAEAGECANEQGKFWQMHDKIFVNQENINVEALKLYALQAGLNPALFNSCLDSGKYRNEVARDFEDGVGAGVRGTPTFFINGRKFEGTIPLDVFKTIIDTELRSTRQ